MRIEHSSPMQVKTRKLRDRFHGNMIVSFVTLADGSAFQVVTRKRQNRVLGTTIVKSVMISAQAVVILSDFENVTHIDFKSARFNVLFRVHRNILASLKQKLKLGESL